jgi:PLP dependent protein
MSDRVSRQERIKNNLNSVIDKIKVAALRSDRDYGEIKLVVVTKNVDIMDINVVLDEEIFDLGENRVQELLKKYDILVRKCNWNLIGHLQNNKVKYIIDKVSMIHSVDSKDLADEIQKQAAKKGIVAKILIQVNVSLEESKYGLRVDAVSEFIDSLQGHDNILVEGLMTIAPYSKNPEDVRYVFKGLKNLFDELKTINQKNVNMRYLSMGMSNDFEIAVEEGANILRVGSAIFFD